MALLPKFRYVKLCLKANILVEISYRTRLVPRLILLSYSQNDFISLLQREVLHAAFGITVVALLVIQIIAGMARPDGDAGRKRLIFNWFHRLCGILTYVLALTALFTGTNIDYLSDELMDNGTIIVILLLVLPVAMAVAMEIVNRCCSRGEWIATSVNHKSSINIQATSQVYAVYISFQHDHLFTSFFFLA